MNDENFHRLSGIRVVKNRHLRKTRKIIYPPKRRAVVGKSKRSDVGNSFNSDLYWGRWFKYSDE